MPESNVEEQLAQQQEQEQANADKLNEINQLERMAAMEEEQKSQDPRSQAARQAKQIAMQQAKRVATTAGKKAVVAGGRAAAAAASSALAAIGSFLAVSAPIWGPILGVFVAAIFIIIVLVSACNSTGGWLLNLGTKIVTFGQVDICGPLKLPNISPLAVSRTQPFPGEPDDLVYLSTLGIPVKSDIDDRARQCMANKVKKLYEQSVASGLNWRVTSGFRAGAVTIRPDGTRVPSAHSRGEAVDIAFTELPARPWSTNPQIARLVALAKSLDFKQPSGDTLDEYNNPTEYATAGHIHIEFNRANQQIYCDTTI